jgi:hypothetical protein
LSSKDLRRNPIAIFNSILSARLICVLDFIFAETTLSELSAWLADCWPTTSPRSGLRFSITNPHALSRTLIAKRQEKPISPAFDNVHSVPVQAGVTPQVARRLSDQDRMQRYRMPVRCCSEHYLYLLRIVGLEYNHCCDDSQ